MVRLLIKNLLLNPKKMFLIDGLGAVLSAFLLGIVLIKLESIIGIPPSTLYSLAIFPLLFAIYDFYCYLKKHSRLKSFLKGIAIANLLYCCFSIGIAFYHLKTITNLGCIYILTEILIIIILSIFELMIAKQLTKN